MGVIKFLFVYCLGTLRVSQDKLKCPTRVLFSVKRKCLRQVAISRKYLRLKSASAQTRYVRDSTIHF